jgi:hypothetical protein
MQLSADAPPGESKISKMSDDVLVLILSHLSIKDVWGFAGTCRSAFNFVNTKREELAKACVLLVLQGWAASYGRPPHAPLYSGRAAVAALNHESPLPHFDELVRTLAATPAYAVDEWEVVARMLASDAFKLSNEDLLAKWFHGDTASRWGHWPGGLP